MVLSSKNYKISSETSSTMQLFKDSSEENAHNFLIHDDSWCTISNDFKKLLMQCNTIGKIIKFTSNEENNNMNDYDFYAKLNFEAKNVLKTLISFYSKCSKFLFIEILDYDKNLIESKSHHIFEKINSGFYKMKILKK